MLQIRKYKRGKPAGQDSCSALVDEPDTVDRDNWCCMHCVLSLQDDFMNEKPMLQH